MSFASSYDPSEAYTIDEEISAGKSVEISHGNMQFKTRFTDLDMTPDRHVVVSHQSLIAKYHHILNDYIQEIELDEEMQRRYYQRPKLLSTDLYGTPELWSWIMYINNCKSLVNFTKTKVKVFTRNIDEAIDEILTISNQDLEDNRDNVYPSNL